MFGAFAQVVRDRGDPFSTTSLPKEPSSAARFLRAHIIDGEGNARGPAPP